ncbi:MAG: site-2 protease family protein, partial [Rectinema sp.]|nr:site-2 protease family protein [Rectinema sp.]
FRLGDNTARSMGRLTLNPLKHLDIIGTIMVFLVGIGWAKPVPVDFRNLRNPKRDMIWVAAAGPVTNFALAALSALALRVIMHFEPAFSQFSLASMFLNPVSLMLGFSVYINLLLCLFNLIPVPPLDGGRVVVGILPHRQALAYSRIEPYGMIIIIVLVFFTKIFQYVLAPLLDLGIRLLAGSQSGLIYALTGFLLR